MALSDGVLLGPSAWMESLARLRATLAALTAAGALMLAPGLVEPLEEAFVGREPAGPHGRRRLAEREPIRLLGRGPAVAVVGVATTATADEAAAVGAIVEMTFLYAGFDDPAFERDEISRNAVMVRTCERIGILYMIEPLSARTDATGRTSRPGRRLATQDENPLCQHRVRCCAASDY